MSSPSHSKILLIGDSLTQTSFEGWGAGLAHRYQRRADILNRGMSGYNTRWWLEYANQAGVWNESGDIKFATIWFGANDASLAAENPHHHIPYVPEFQWPFPHIFVSEKPIVVHDALVAE